MSKEDPIQITTAGENADSLGLRERALQSDIRVVAQFVDNGLPIEIQYAVQRAEGLVPEGVFNWKIVDDQVIVYEKIAD